MICKLDHSNTKIAEKIQAVFQVSYKIEAALLKADDFPPLKRTLSEFLYCNDTFYGYYIGKELAAVVEIGVTKNTTHIQSLVVDPKHFRKGLASKLVQYVFDTYSSDVYTVETGLDNVPAIKLYQRFGFKEIKQWDTDHGVRKVKFVLNI